ncbi:hypothetical protein D1AOALGA4SA_8186 [Olavius algarvensis Delta 1 endosymbiont]|nr:hypothetical protein D1AOALGA4SA_8186 [Olavius algarvensis Delta 1 endosymbiont]
MFLKSACICENLRPKLLISNLQRHSCLSPDRMIQLPNVLEFCRF